VIIEFGVFLSLIALGFIFGRINEAAHFASLSKREMATSHIILSDKKSVPEGISHSQFVSGNAVISIDYYKRVAAGLRMIFGGEMRSYQSLLTRARREAILRMVEQATSAGSSYIANVRIETSSVFQNERGVGSIEVYAYGTALH